MPRASGDSVIASVRSRGLRVLFVVLLFGAIFSGFYLWEKHQNTTDCDLRIQDQCIKLERATTQAQREKGLSGRASLAKNKGMLFIFDRPGNYCFWMKDTKFDLDIIWLNADKTIVAIEKYVKPDTYPDSFCPQQPAQYVIELNAGMVDKANYQLGQKINL